MAKRLKEKTEKINQTRDTRPYAKAKFLRLGNSKLDIVMDLVRGKGYMEAVAILKNTPNKDDRRKIPPEGRRDPRRVPALRRQHRPRSYGGVLRRQTDIKRSL